MSRARDLADLGNNAGGLETLTVSDITDITATASELNKLDGVTATTDELNLVDGSVSGPLSHRNMIINGGMQIWQRATSATTVTSGYQTVDRFGFFEGTHGAYTVEQETLSVADQGTTGQRTAIELNVTSQTTSLSNAQYAYFRQRIEAQNCQHLAYGSSGAKTLTLSFWVKSNLTGTYTVFLRKNDSTLYYIVKEYTISSANTWEKKEITITPTEGSTSLITSSSGVINNDNGPGIDVGFGLAFGSDFHTTKDTWQTAEDYSTSSAVNWMNSTSNNFYLTGVQLELGSVATPFEHRSFADELARCQRYFYKCTRAAYALGRGNGSSNIADLGLPVAVPMRDTDNLTFDGTGQWYAIDSGSYVNGTNAGFTPITGVEHGIIITGQVSGLNSMTDNRFGMVLFSSGYSFHSEL